jgi:hypothetical protein
MLKALDEAKGLAITVGIHAEEGGESDGTTTVEDVANANEFGLGVPARPFIGPWADEKRDEAVRRMRDASAEALHAHKSPAQRLDQLAQVFAGEVQAKIASGIPPENAPATIARKARGTGSTTTLIDTGTLRSAIRGKVGPA